MDIDAGVWLTILRDYLDEICCETPVSRCLKKKYRVFFNLNPKTAGKKGAGGRGEGELTVWFFEKMYLPQRE